MTEIMIIQNMLRCGPFTYIHKHAHYYIGTLTHYYIGTKLTFNGDNAMVERCVKFWNFRNA